MYAQTALQGACVTDACKPWFACHEVKENKISEGLAVYVLSTEDSKIHISKYQKYFEYPTFFFSLTACSYTDDSNISQTRKNVHAPWMKCDTVAVKNEHSHVHAQIDCVLLHSMQMHDLQHSQIYKKKDYTWQKKNSLFDM